MSKEKQEQKLQDEVTWAYQVLDGFINAFNEASTKPIMLENQLKIECLNKLPELFEALATLTPLEHQPILYQFFKAMTNYIKAWGQAKKG